MTYEIDDDYNILAKNEQGEVEYKAVLQGSPDTVRQAAADHVNALTRQAWVIGKAMEAEQRLELMRIELEAAKAQNRRLLERLNNLAKYINSAIDG